MIHDTKWAYQNRAVYHRQAARDWLVRARWWYGLNVAGAALRVARCLHHYREEHRQWIYFKTLLRRNKKGT
jgi:hypothetical protein